MPSIHPVHYSIRNTGAGRTPHKMDRVKCCDEATREGLTNVALNIFTSVANSGNTFQDAILAVYLSGLNHGSEVQKEKREEDDKRHTPGTN